MSGSARSEFIFGIYEILLGIILIVVPNLLFGVLGIAATTEPWVRVAGMLLLALGIFYILASLRGMIDFIRWSVFTRTSIIFFFTAFVLLHLAPPILILLGSVDLVAAIWTAFALRSEGDF